MDIKDNLRKYRYNQSTKQGIPAYCIFSNAVLESLINLLPKDTTELLHIKGIGQKMIYKYGTDITHICGGGGIDELSNKQPSEITPSEITPAEILPAERQLLNKVPPESRSLNELPSEYTLSPDQEKALALCDTGKNIFLSGQGGTGKSFLINLIVQKYQNTKNVQVCALTGVAAEIIGCKATTVHSWAGTGLARGNPLNIVNRVLAKDKRKNWLRVNLLIIDEVSMMSKKLFEVLDLIGKTVRQSELPFGGIQVIFSGDFHQLPPVGNDKDPDSGKFCFESPLWHATFPDSVVLRTLFRQKDPLFTRILQQIRKGKITRGTYDILSKRIIDKQDIHTKDITIIYPIRRLVDRVNQTRMDSLDTETCTYTYNYVYTEDFDVNTPTSLVKHEQELLENCLLAPKEITLKQGAKVMCVANLQMDSDQQIINGSQGYIVEFVGGVPLVKFLNGVTKKIDYHCQMSEEVPGLGIKQIPLILSWAITIHKSQGITLDKAIIDAGQNIFEHGQTYVAFSRLKTLEGLFLLDFNPHKVTTNAKVKKFYETLY